MMILALVDMSFDDEDFSTYFSMEISFQKK